MIDGIDYSKVLEIEKKADYLGFIIIPPYFKQSIIEPVRNPAGSDLFKIEINKLRYPTVPTVTVHQGNFNSVEVFVAGAYLLHNSLLDLGVITEADVLTAAQHFILMDKIRKSN